MSSRNKRRSTGPQRIIVLSCASTKNNMAKGQWFFETPMELLKLMSSFSKASLQISQHGSHGFSGKKWKNVASPARRATTKPRAIFLPCRHWWWRCTWPGQSWVLFRSMLIVRYFLVFPFHLQPISAFLSLLVQWCIPQEACILCQGTTSDCTSYLCISCKR